MSEKNISKKKILLAEDDKFISRAYKDGLTRAGFEVVHASDGVVAMEKLKSFSPDIILLDIIMPEKNGFETLEEIRKNPKFSKVPIFILSNLGQASDIEKGKELGASDYLIKSDFSISEVVKRINKYI